MFMNIYARTRSLVLKKRILVTITLLSDLKNSNFWKYVLYKDNVRCSTVLDFDESFEVNI